MNPTKEPEEEWKERVQVQLEGLVSYPNMIDGVNKALVSMLSQAKTQGAREVLSKAIEEVKYHPDLNHDQKESLVAILQSNLDNEKI